MKPINNYMRNTPHSPSVFGFSLAIIVYLGVSSLFFYLMLPIAGLFWLNGLIAVAELFRAFAIKKSYSQLWRGFLHAVFAKNSHGYPSRFKPADSHWLPVLAIVCFVTLPPESSAEYRLVDSASYDRALVEGSIGTTPADVVAGFCDSCTLDIAIQQVVPSDITLHWADNVRRSQVVSYRGPNKWAYILKELAIENDLVIIIRPKDAMGKNSMSIARAPKGHGALILESPKANTVVGLATKKFTLLTDQNLRENLQRWAASEGKSIAWELERTPMVDFEATFTGNLGDAITQVIASYRARGDLREVEVSPALNDVIVIRHARDGE